MGKRIFIGVLICIIALTFSALAQETTGGIQGTVKDVQGAVVSGATVEASSPALVGKKTATTDGGGNYRFTELPPGTYELTITAKNLGVSKQTGIRLEVGSVPTINVVVKPGEAIQTVEVNAEAGAVDVTQSKVQSNVTKEILDNIPKGRSFQTVIPFAAGARQEPLQGTTTGRTNGFQIDGASDGENSYLIDGINTTNIQNGGVGANFQMDFIQEVQIKSSSFEAEYGGALGGVINAIPKHGTNSWHGEAKAYFQLSGLDANDPCASGFTSGGLNPPGATGSTVCGLRLKAKTQINPSTRQDGVAEYYVPNKDDRRVIEPGFEIGGPILKDRLTIFSSYIPTLDTIRRPTTFTGTSPGKRTLTQEYRQYSMYNRLDYHPITSLNLFAGWNYAYSKVTGQLANPDSAFGQPNASSSSDPAIFNKNSGSVNPLAVWAFGGDWTPTSKLVLSTRYGYFFANNETRGTPIGIRKIYDTGLVQSDGNVDGQNHPIEDPKTHVKNPCTTDVTGACVPNSAPFGQAGSFNMPSNFATQFNPLKQKSWNTDGSYFVGNFLGSHTFKSGYMWQSRFNEVSSKANTAVVDLHWGEPYTPVTSTAACDAISSKNAGNLCEGQYGYFFTGSTALTNTGKTNATDQALYVQDAWTVKNTGLTLNLGLRLDHENNPPYDPTRFPAINFGWGDKIAPRIGGAYDLLHNGKVKIYASYGKFFDIMKLGLTRGSFGSDYWHECVYALDTLDPTTINPTLTTGAGCPATGQAPGVTGRFIENVDLRATKIDPRDPAVQAGMKPLQNHEIVTGVDWAISPTYSLQTRYAHKRIDNAIEDMSITDNLGFYVGNPGTSFADVLHRPTAIKDANGNNYLNTVPFCAECPAVAKPIRRYDSLEISLTKASSANWYGKVSYTYSRLTGNYPGLTDTDATDGGGGRHAPNNSRLFDIPTQTYLPSGKIDDGPLPTDRPHTATVYGYYGLHWFGHQTWFGIIETALQGSPISTCLSVVSGGSACQWAEGRGNFVRFHRDDATGNIVRDGVVNDARTPPLVQTDFSVKQDFRVSRTHENIRMVFEANAYNLLNQHAPVGYNENVIAAAAGAIAPTRASRFVGDPLVDWGKLMNGYNYMDALNGTGTFAGTGQSPQILASRYGKANVFQAARQFRLGVHIVF